MYLSINKWQSTYFSCLCNFHQIKVFFQKIFVWVVIVKLCFQVRKTRRYNYQYFTTQSKPDLAVTIYAWRQGWVMRVRGMRTVSFSKMPKYISVILLTQVNVIFCLLLLCFIISCIICCIIMPLNIGYEISIAAHRILGFCASLMIKHVPERIVF